MGLAQGIRTHGFRKWHERELIGSHAWLVVTLVSGVIAFASLESMLQNHGLLNQAMNGLVGLGAAAVAMISLQRFLARLVRAQKASSQATCPQCETFGRLAVVGEDREATWVRVRCRQCSHEWVIEDL